MKSLLITLAALAFAAWLALRLAATRVDQAANEPAPATLQQAQEKIDKAQQQLLDRANKIEQDIQK